MATLSILRRTMDPARLNAAANHADVRPHLGAAPELETIDLSPLVTDPANVALDTPHGGFLVHHIDGGVYEVHSIFAPEGRRNLRAATAEGLRYVFTATDAHTVRTKVPTYNRAADALAKASGFREVFTREGGGIGPDGQPCAVSYREITLREWMARDRALEAHGEWFHHRLEAAKIAAGSTLAVHDHDPAHERAVGAAVLMFRAGNPTKAVATYNEWAGFAGYAPLSLLSLNPPVIDVVDAVVEIQAPEMEILQCR